MSPLAPARNLGFLKRTGGRSTTSMSPSISPTTFDAANAPDTVRLMRHILARNRKITIVGIGPLANLADLLGSLPDDISPRPGRELIAGSVDTLVQMGERVPGGEKFNFQTHPSAAREVVNKWPTPILFSGKEVGGRISAGEQLLRTPRTNPVRMAYKLHTQGWMKGFGFDHTAVLYAVRGFLTTGIFPILDDALSTRKARTPGHPAGMKGTAT